MTHYNGESFYLEFNVRRDHLLSSFVKWKSNCTKFLLADLNAVQVYQNMNY